jgi:lipopolysaccharide export system permease protein
MLKIYQRFLAKRYFKNFLILFLALEFFFTGIDLMQNFKYLPPSANLQIIYGVNKFLGFSNYTLPLSLVFAMISTIFALIKSSELVALYSLGLSKKEIIKPIFFIASLITLLYITLGFTGFTSANYKADNIKKYGQVSIATNDLFLKSQNNYIAIKELYPLKKEAQGIKIFKTKGTQLEEIIEAQRATFENNRWSLSDVKTIIKDPIKQKLTITHQKQLFALENFRPEVIDNLYKGEGGLSIQNSLLAMGMLKKEHIDDSKIRAHLYIITIFPLFAPIIILALFYPLPLQRRGSNLALLSSTYIFSTLLIWGVIFTLSKIALNGTLSPEMGIIFPIALLIVFATIIIYKES